jgi:beta-lactamase class D
MEAEGFTVNPNEWWHFDYRDWREYAIYDLAFSEIRNPHALTGYRVGRVYFYGGGAVRDLTLRKHIFLREGDVFTIDNLEKSISGLNGLEKFERITEQEISWFPQKEEKRVDFTFHLAEKGGNPDIAAARIEERKSLKNIFDAAGVTGGAYVYDPQQNKFTVCDRRRMDTPLAPASTSKIIHSLVFLDTGALKDETETLKWDGVRRRVEAWNQDHDLRSALKTSAVWFYVEASKRVGRDRMQRAYDAADYGNRSTEGFGADYWNAGALRVTPRQQIEFLVRFYENRLPFATRSVEKVKEILVDERTGAYTISGKTGWSDAFTPQVGWWIGYVETGGKVYFFAVEIDIKKDTDAARRKEIAKMVLRSLKIIK